MIRRILTSHAAVGATGQTTGVWLGDLTARDDGFAQAGAEVAGRSVPIDPKSLGEADRLAGIARLLADPAAMSALFVSTSLKDVSPRNRVGVPPMHQDSAADGVTNGSHLGHRAGHRVGSAPSGAAERLARRVRRPAMAVAALAGAALLGLAPAAAAEAPVAAWPPPGRSDSTRMPGDITPPPVAETLQPFTSKPDGERHLPPPDPTPAVPMGLALEAAEAVVAACDAKGARVAAGVTDASGVLRVGLSADGASPPGRLFGGVPKAVAAIAFRAPTSAIRAQLMADPKRAAAVMPNMLVLPGGVPIFSRGRLLGAIGVSGASADDDEDCAQAGVAAIQAKLDAASP